MIKDFNSKFDFEDIDDIDLSKILNFLFRNKTLIASFTIILFIFSTIYSLSKKRFWEGQFRIVVRDNQSINPSQLLGRNSKLLEALDVEGKSSTNLNTEVGILESPSVLMPVFEFFNAEKMKLNNNSEKHTFSSWKNNLDIDRQKNTSILVISYRDNDKELINSVLDKIIGIYQEYSGKGKKRNLELAKKYLEEQINFYKSQGLISMRALQEYAIDQDLTVLNYSINPTSVASYNLELDNNDKIPDFVGQTVNIELSRVKAANKIRNIDAKIKKIESLDKDTDAISYINLTISKLSNEGSIDDLSSVDLKLIELQSKYTDKFPEIIRLKEKRSLLIKMLKAKTISFLKAEKISAEAVLEATTRPKDVLLKYKELARKAQRDDFTLVQLENQKRMISLQQAKLEDPWELITKPTIGSSPVAPRRSLIVVFGTFIGLILGMCASVFKERKTGLIYDKDTLESIFNIKIIDDIDLNNPNSNLFIKELFRQKKNYSFKFIYSKYLSKTNPKSLRNIFENKKYNSSIVNDVIDLKENEILILVTSLPQITLNEILKIKNQIEILEKKLFGIVIIKQ